MWNLAEDRLPEPKECITAEIDYMGKVSTVHGHHSASEPGYVYFDFYSGTAGGKIIRWKPRDA